MRTELIMFRSGDNIRQLWSKIIIMFMQSTDTQNIIELYNYVLPWKSWPSSWWFYFWRYYFETGLQLLPKKQENITTINVFRYNLLVHGVMLQSLNIHNCYPFNNVLFECFCEKICSDRHQIFNILILFVLYFKNY
jgi:hypothetical protein